VDLISDILQNLKTTPAQGRVFVNYFYVPALSYYEPALPTTPYDIDWPTQRLADEVMMEKQARVFCSTSVCRGLEMLLPVESVKSREIVRVPDEQTGIPGKPPGEALEVFSFSK
jgi:hypothetical protein